MGGFCAIITIYDWFGYKTPIKERYKKIKQAGFDGVLLWWSELLNRGDYKNAPLIARNAGLFIENIHTPFQVQDYIWDNNINGETAIQTYIKCVKDCAEFDIPTMVIHLPDDDKPYNELGINRLKQLAQNAESYNVNIAFENLNNITNLYKILDTIQSPQVGLCYDCCHQVRYYPNSDMLTKYKDRIMALHLHDYVDNSIHRLPFDGVTDWLVVMNEIKKTGYLGATSIEAMNWAYADKSIDTFLQQAFIKAKQLENLRDK